MGARGGRRGGWRYAPFTAAALGRASRNIKAGSGDQTPFFMMPLMDRMAWRKGSIQRAGSMVSPLRGLVPQGGPLVARLSRVREVEGYVLVPLFCPQIERPQPEPSVFQLRLVQE